MLHCVHPITALITPSTNSTARLIQFVSWAWHILRHSANAFCMHEGGNIQEAGNLHLQWRVCFVAGRIVMLIPLDRRVQCLSCPEFALVLVSLWFNSPLLSSWCDRQPVLRATQACLNQLPDPSWRFTPHSNACICLSFGHLNIPSSKWFSRILIFLPWHYWKALLKGWRFL